MPSHVTHLLQINLISCDMFLQLCVFGTTYFSSLYYPVKTFARNVAVITINELIFFMK